jgi:hypothetical protein
MPASVRALVGPSLMRERVSELVDAGQLGSRQCSVVWNLADRAVVEPVTQMRLPGGLDLLPIRRVGTYRGAPNAIAMFPVIRDGYALMLTVESRLELSWLQLLACDPRVSALYAQPCLLLWRHEEGAIWRVPDLAAVVDGHLTFFDVKHPERLDDPWTALTFTMTEQALASAGVGFEVLSDMPAQRAHNLQLMSRYRQPNPWLAHEEATVVQKQPRTVGGLIKLIEAARSGEPLPRAWPAVFEVDAVRRGLAVAMHLLATGQCRTDLDRPINVASVLSWVPAPEQSWGRL